MVIGVGNQKGVVAIDCGEAVFRVPGVGPDAVGEHVTVAAVSRDTLLALALVKPRTSFKIAVGLLQSLALCALLLSIQI
jgi:hypothetical protein